MKIFSRERRMLARRIDRIVRPIAQLGVVLVAALAGLASHAQDRPDVLLITIDDLNDWVGPLGGHPQTKTPNIDRLAARGMTFLNAHSPSALCNPSRTAMLTGLRPSTTGVYGNTPDWRTVRRLAGLPTLPRHFRDNGYRTLGAGKIFHAHTYAPAGLTGYNDVDAWDAFWPSKDRQLPDEALPLVRPVTGSSFVGFDWMPLVSADDAVGDGQVAAWIERQLLAETGTPRFVAAGIYRPHLPWYVPERYFDMHPLEDVELPPVLENDLDDVPEAGRRGTLQSTQMHEWVLEEQRWQEGVQAYLASISFADAMVGRLLDALEQSGRAERTIIVLLGDHGFHLGEKGRWRKMTLWEESTRVPLIIVAPGVTTAGSSTEEAVSLMDVYPTLAELASVATPAHLEGRSLVPMLTDPAATRDEPALITYGFRNHAIRDERYRYIRYADGSEELYDHRTDPNEWTNLAGLAEHAETKARLARFLPTQDAPNLGAMTTVDRE